MASFGTYARGLTVTGRMTSEQPSFQEIPREKSPEVLAVIKAFRPVLDFESDELLVCNRDQTGDTTCESCQ